MGLREDKVGSLEDEAKRRREKLLALKRRRRGEEGQEEEHRQEGEGGEGDKAQGGEELPAPQVLFRNYNPESESLQTVSLPSEDPADVDTLVKTQLEDGEKAKEEVQAASPSPGPTHSEPKQPHPTIIIEDSSNEETTNSDRCRRWAETHFSEENEMSTGDSFFDEMRDFYSTISSSSKPSSKSSSQSSVPSSPSPGHSAPYSAPPKKRNTSQKAQRRVKVKKDGDSVDNALKNISCVAKKREVDTFASAVGQVVANAADKMPYKAQLDFMAKILEVIKDINCDIAAGEYQT